MRHLSFDNTGVCTEIRGGNTFQFSRFCGLCCGTSDENDHMVSGIRQNRSTKFFSFNNRGQQMNSSLQSSLSTRY